MQEVLVNRLDGLSLPRKSVVRFTDRPDMTLDVYPGHRTQHNNTTILFLAETVFSHLVGWFVVLGLTAL